MHRLLLHNGKILDSRERAISPGQVGFLNGWGVFSTLRVSAGVLFAFERHYNRMKHDAARVHVPFNLSAEELQDSLHKLVDANQALDATLRVAVVRNRGGIFEGEGIDRECDLVAFTSNLTPWGEGVNLSYQANGRFAACPFAGAKITSWAQNLVWNEEAHQRGFDEVILLNEHGQVSECTSANIFAVQGDEVCTPPLRTSGCLPGITRALLLEEIHLDGLRVVERELTPADLASADQVFITSTTRDMLPVFTVDHRGLSQHAKLMETIRRQFADYRATYNAAHARETQDLKKEMLAV